MRILKGIKQMTSMKKKSPISSCILQKFAFGMYQNMYELGGLLSEPVWTMLVISN